MVCDRITAIPLMIPLLTECTFYEQVCCIRGNINAVATNRGRGKEFFVGWRLAL